MHIKIRKEKIMVELTEVRKHILDNIEKNSRIDLRELAIMIGSTEAEVANEIAEMEKENIISGYHTLINWENTSEEKVTALIEVTVTPQRGIGFDRIAERIQNFSEVKSIYLMSGGYDFQVLLEEKTMRAVSQFVSEKLSTLESVRGTVTHFVLKKYKDHGTVINEIKEDERMLVTP